MLPHLHISKFKNINFDTKYEINKVRQLLHSSALVYERAKDKILEMRPDKIFTFNNRFATTYPIICAAKKFNVNINIHERGSDINKFEIYPNDAHDINEIKKKY